MNATTTTSNPKIKKPYHKTTKPLSRFKVVVRVDGQPRKTQNREILSRYKGDLILVDILDRKFKKTFECVFLKNRYTEKSDTHYWQNLSIWSESRAHLGSGLTQSEINFKLLNLFN